MARLFAPAAAGQWKFALDDEFLVVADPAGDAQCDLGDPFDIVVSRGWPWATVELTIADRSHRLGALSTFRAKRIVSIIEAARDDLLLRRRLKKLQEQFDQSMDRVVHWAGDLDGAAARQISDHGWLTHEFAVHWGAEKESTGFGTFLDEPLLNSHVEAQRESRHPCFAIWDRDFATFIRGQNDLHLDDVVRKYRPFFDTVEKSPLTDEQARAVVCFDNRMLVVASAGSGKTSTMVAKAGYALRRGLVPADRILMLAFNNAAAKELKQRTLDRLIPLGLDADKVTVRTFHAFGIDVIGQATGRKPTVAPWLQGGDIARLGDIVRDLRASDPAFRTRWDFFRAVLARDYVDSAAHDSTDEPTADAAVYRTAQGEEVASSGERLIADWLYFNGVAYEYERPYEIDTADSEHRQYRPDFYYPTIGVYHEHWALDEDGQPPPEFEGYLDGVHWKRGLHREHGTALLETTMAELWSGRALDALARELTSRGVRLQFDPERPVRGEKIIENERLLQTFRSFLVHAKSNELSDDALQKKLDDVSDGQVRFRYSSFLALFAAIRVEWERRLAAEGCIDFEDMLNLAAGHLENGDWQSPHDLVMVDEFQDASYARARLSRALVALPERHLFAVGDDWQSINRFAGADVSVMTDFERWFGPAEVLRLERTFRFPQSIADVSSQFVLKNPTQIAKSVTSSTAEYPPTIEVVSVVREDAVAEAIRYRLKELHRRIQNGDVPALDGRKVTAFVLGRYNYQAKYLSHAKEVSDLLDVRFMTAHGSKGAEADFIVIPGMTSGKWGFPSTIPDDPVLRLAMPEAEEFARAEERRLFYVALTRARRGVMLVTVDKKESPFLVELVRDSDLLRTNVIGEELDSVVCPCCARAFMVKRSSKGGPFWGCQLYPRCRGTLASSAGEVAHP
ncbi:UvrD-helicase domain-containing protein [Mycetocola sp. 2940]|uniref:UvrD-helicase domain-containing protein n=1 Tax=Mycetocola sp. 2940 TaxID=3156452 RepID=UPI0033968D4C